MKSKGYNAAQCSEYSSHQLMIFDLYGFDQELYCAAREVIKFARVNTEPMMISIRLATLQVVNE
jgi:hypothetical protein